MYLFLLFVLTISFERILSQSADEVDYFVNVVESGIEQAYTFVLPTSAESYRATRVGLRLHGIYDFIVAGTGTSGAALAGRLSQISKWSTLALEAGTFEDDFVDIPAMHYYERGTTYNWAYNSIPQTSCCLGLINRTCPFPRGRGFGGTSITNAGIYSRAKRGDFERWAAEGNPGWNYASVLEYFTRAENATLLHGDVGFHGLFGPVNVQYVTETSNQTREYINANIEVGVPEGDYNGAEELRVSRIETNIRNGRRLTSARAYLEPVIDRKNLHLLSESYVTRIFVEEKLNIRAVFFTRQGQKYVALARKEIILSAGAIGSPQILMLSGIGPADHLRELNIPLVKNLSVGNNFQDHPLYFGVNFESNLTYTPLSVRQYVEQYLRGTGFYTVIGNLQGIGFYDFDLNANDGYPEIEMIHLPSPSFDNYTRISLALTDDSYNAIFRNVNPLNSFIIYIILLHPKSKGTIRLASSDPYVYPLIDPNWFTDANNTDLNTIYRSIMFIRDQLGNTEAFKRMDARMTTVNVTACSHLTYDSEEYWYCNIRYLSLNIYHPCCTNRMGPDPTQGAVVDSRFRVHGYKSLRVVDASAFPFSFAGHPASNCIMIAERTFDFILEDHLLD